MAHNIGLATDIYSRPSEQWVKDVLAMVVGHIIYAGSKLALSNTYKDFALWQLYGVAKIVNVEKHCYKRMDKLLERQGSTQKTFQTTFDQKQADYVRHNFKLLGRCI